MVSGGTEFIVGVSYDSQLGPIILFGTGGVMVEVYNDVALRQCPITTTEAREMINQVKGSKLLSGFRGSPKGDIDALVSTLVSVSNLAVHLDGELSELDINPLMVLSEGNGVKAADALAAL
jgi:acetyltransferase